MLGPPPRLKGIPNPESESAPGSWALDPASPLELTTLKQLKNISGAQDWGAPLPHHICQGGPRALCEVEVLAVRDGSRV